MKRESYDWVMQNDAQDFALSPGTKSEIKCIFTNMRVDRKTLPEGKHLYEIMGTDNGNIGNGIIKENVLVNFVGSLITDQPIKMTHRDWGFANTPYRGVGSYSFC